MSDTATPSVETEADRPRAVARGFDLLAGTGPGLLADLMKSDAAPAEQPAPLVASEED